MPRIGTGGGLYASSVSFDAVSSACGRGATGLVYSTHFKVKQVIAPGQDPLARGWTRGGEIYMCAPFAHAQAHALSARRPRDPLCAA